MMSMEPRRGGWESSSELLQIVLLTLAMTGGGLLILFLLLQFVLVPGLREDVATTASKYERLTKLLNSEETQYLRLDQENRKATPTDISLQRVILDNLDANGLEPDGLRAPRLDDGAEKHTVQLKAGPMTQILRFVIGVRETKKTVEVQSVQLNRPPGRNRQEGMFTASVDFVDYAPPKRE